MEQITDHRADGHSYTAVHLGRVVNVYRRTPGRGPGELLGQGRTFRAAVRRAFDVDVNDYFEPAHKPNVSGDAYSDYTVGNFVHVGLTGPVWEIIVRNGAKMTIQSPRGAKRTVAIDRSVHHHAVF